MRARGTSAVSGVISTDDALWKSKRNWQVTRLKEIALKTRTALDQAPPEEEAVLRERAAMYEVGFEEWDSLVAELAR